MEESKWYFQKGFYYLLIRAEETDHVYFDQNLDVLLFWLN